MAATFDARIHGNDYRVSFAPVRVDDQPLFWLAHFSWRSGSGGGGRRVDLGRVGSTLDAMLRQAWAGRVPGWALADALQDEGLDDAGILDTVRNAA